MATAAAEIHDLDDRRKALAAVNPKLAKDSELMPEPHVSDLTHEHFAINLPAMVREALDSLNAGSSAYEPSQEEYPAAEAEATPVEQNPAPVQDYIEPQQYQNAPAQPLEAPAAEAPMNFDPETGEPINPQNS